MSVPRASVLLAVRNAAWKLILASGRPELLFWTERDPEERWNRVHDAAEPRAALESLAGPYTELQEALHEEKIEEALKAVGYIQ